MIRVLHVVHGLFKSGGLANCVMNYYRNIDRTQVQFDFLYFIENDYSFRDEIESLGGRCFRLNEPSLSFNYRKESDEFFKLHNGEWIAMHCHALFAAALFGDSAKKNGIPCIIAHAHSTVYGKGIIRKMRNYAIIQMTRWTADYYVACGEKAGRFLFGNKAYNRGKVTIFNNAINIEKFAFSIDNRQKIRKELGIGDNLVLGHVGGFAGVKNHTFLIDIFVEILKRVPNSFLLLAGGEGTASGSTKSEIVAKVNALGISEYVKFLGVRSDIFAVLSALDVYCQPSIFEGMPISVIEAQTCGLPCVLSDTITRGVDIGNSTFLPLSESAEYWAETIIQKCSCCSSREQGILLAQKAGFDIKVVVSDMLNFYKSISKNA